MSFGGSGRLLCVLEAMKSFPDQGCALPVLNCGPVETLKEKKDGDGVGKGGAVAGPAAKSCGCV